MHQTQWSYITRKMQFTQKFDILDVFKADFRDGDGGGWYSGFWIGCATSSLPGCALLGQARFRLATDQQREIITESKYSATHFYYFILLNLNLNNLKPI